MALPAGEEALHLVAILDHDHGRADDVFAFGLVRLLEEHVADEVRRARGRRLHVDAGMLQALDARLHQLAVVIEQRSLVERACLVGHRRHPIGAVLGEQLHPFAEAPLVEQPRLLDQERLERRAIEAGGGRRRGSARGGHAASRI